MQLILSFVDQKAVKSLGLMGVADNYLAGRQPAWSSVELFGARCDDIPADR